MKSDAELQSDVVAALTRTSGERLRDVSATAEGGIVVLRGEVLTFADREAAEKAARRVAGVTAVVNEIAAAQDPINLSLDSLLAREIVEALRELGSGASAINVAVADRVVTLGGEADEESVRSAARDAAEAVPGVQRVVNLIRVTGTVVPGDVERQIAAAFDAEGMSGAGRVRVELDDHLARLSGTLDSVAERDVAEAAAGATPGVTAVEDDLTMA